MLPRGKENAGALLRWPGEVDGVEEVALAGATELL
jgi:hypothetical protein